MGGIEGSTVGVLGLAFKPNTDDVRESPAIDIIMRLLDRGVRIKAHDPVAMGNASSLLPDISYCEDPYHVAEGSDALLLATEWREYLELDWKEMGSRMRGRVILDGRNLLDGIFLSELGFTYLSCGRSPIVASNGRFPKLEPVAVQMAD